MSPTNKLVYSEQEGINMFKDRDGALFFKVYSYSVQEYKGEDKCLVLLHKLYLFSVF